MMLIIVLCGYVDSFENIRLINLLLILLLWVTILER